MKIAIHDRANSFSDRWILYCESNCIPYIKVNAYDSNIVQQIGNCNAFLWHHHQSNIKDVIFAKQLIYSLESSGIKVFPNFNTCWHFDDKIGQKYLLEAMQAPLVPTYIFYSKEDALNWISQATFPKVFKPSKGAGSKNVHLVSTRSQAKKLVEKAFSKGFSQYDPWLRIKDRWQLFKCGKKPITSFLYSLFQVIYSPEFSRKYKNEWGYIYFQDFLPNNSFDIRIIVIGNKAFGIKRLTRENDFRASGSGRIVYEKNDIDERCVVLAFDFCKKLKSQCTAFDFIFDGNNNPLIIEISYGFTAAAYDDCEGYWTDKMEWVKGPFNPYGWIIDNLINETLF